MALRYLFTWLLLGLACTSVPAQVLDPSDTGELRPDDPGYDEASARQR